MDKHNENLIKAVKHYQDGLERHTQKRNEAKLLHYLQKLHKLTIKVSHLEETGVGRTVNSLRKLGGEVGDAAKSLVSKWKEMVVDEEEVQKAQAEPDDEEEDDEDDDKDEGYVPEEDEDKASHKSDNSRDRQDKASESSSHHRSNHDHKKDPDKKSKSLESQKHKSSEKVKNEKPRHDSDNDSENDGENGHSSKKSNDAENRTKSKPRNKSKRRRDSDSDSEDEKQKQREKKKHKSSRHGSDTESRVESKSSKDKDRSKSTKSSSSSHKSKKHDKDKKDKSDDSRSKSSSTLKSSSSKDKDRPSKSSSSKQSSSKEKSEKSKKSDSSSKSKLKQNNTDFDAGGSFAEALGMCGPTSSSKKSKKKLVTSESNSDRNLKDENFDDEQIPKFDLIPPKLKEPILEPLDINISSLLPPITPNYRPLGLPVDSHPKKLLTDDEALQRVMASKNQRTKVYSGNKVLWSKVPSLFEICIRILQDNIDALEYTGGVPYSILKAILEKANPDQLYMMEHHNPYLIEDTDELWQLHCQREFKTKAREEMESWRDMYMRCLDEREAKLKALTANIKQSQDKSLPVRTTKLAYVDSVAKAPRNIARKQVKNGTAYDVKPSVTPSSRLSALATSGEAGKIAVPNPGSRAAERSERSGNSHALKPKKAPLMAKTLSLFKNRFRR